MRLWEPFGQETSFYKKKKIDEGILKSPSKIQNFWGFHGR
jgi:hypothetical protein